MLEEPDDGGDAGGGGGGGDAGEAGSGGNFSIVTGSFSGLYICKFLSFSIIPSIT